MCKLVQKCLLLSSSVCVNSGTISYTKPTHVLILYEMDIGLLYTKWSLYQIVFKLGNGPTPEYTINYQLWCFILENRQTMYNLNRDRYTHIKVWTLFSNLQNVFRLSSNLQNRRQTCSPEISGILESSCRLLFCAFFWMFCV